MAEKSHKETHSSAGGAAAHPPAVVPAVLASTVGAPDKPLPRLTLLSHGAG